MYSDKIYGCFLGKCIGGTLGMPYEGRREFLDLDFYDPVPTEAVANDDLDLQLVWLQHIKEKGLSLDNRDLAQAWLDHIDAHPDEYGVALWNIKKGLEPPLTGIHNNFFTHGLGSAIRSEIWASLFPGRPRTAAYYAFQDASVDHWNEGIYSEIFLAASQSELYTTDNINDAIDCGLKFLPETSKLKKAITDVISWYNKKLAYDEARWLIMRHYGSNNFTDCIMNLCFIVLGLLYGEGDFEKSLLYAVNCGQDADCTGATIGGFMGIFLGREKIPQKWVEPIGEKIIVGDYIKGLNPPENIQMLLKEIEDCQEKFAKSTFPEIKCPFILPEIKDFSDEISWKVNGIEIIAEGTRIPLSKYVVSDGKKIELQTNVTFQETGDIQLMACSKGLIETYWDGRLLGLKGDQSDMIPAFHRVAGGRVFPLEVTKGKSYQLTIKIYSTSPVPDLLVAFADMKHRYLNVSYS